MSQHIYTHKLKKRSNSFLPIYKIYFIKPCWTSTNECRIWRRIRFCFIRTKCDFEFLLVIMRHILNLYYIYYLIEENMISFTDERDSLYTNYKYNIFLIFSTTLLYRRIKMKLKLSNKQRHIILIFSRHTNLLFKQQT